MIEPSKFYKINVVVYLLQKDQNYSFGVPFKISNIAIRYNYIEATLNFIFLIIYYIKNLLFFLVLCL